MNKRNLKRLRKHLAAQPPASFDLSRWLLTADGTGPSSFREEGITNSLALEGSCGTTACIAGHALALFYPDEVVPQEHLIPLTAAAALGLTDIEADTLFIPFRGEDYNNGSGERMRKAITLPQAIRVIDHMIATGEVDWNQRYERA